MTTDIVLHWYPESPFANKVSWLLNYKKIAYKTVKIDICEPRPLRRPLDAGYRKTPILQIGNQVYCDSKAIIEQLEEMVPEPSLFPVTTANGTSTVGAAHAWSLLLDSVVFTAVASQFELAQLPPNFFEDRLELLGAKITPEEWALKRPVAKIDLDAHLARVHQSIPVISSPDAPAWLLGTATPSVADFSLAMNTWFMQLLIPDELAKYPRMTAHFQQLMPLIDPKRVYGMPAITAEDALAIAKEQQKMPSANTVPPAYAYLTKGQKVGVTPTDLGIQAAIGELVALTDKHVILKITDERTNAVYVHLPLVYFAIVPI
ncbi:hypothetical protein BC940DRAFT_136969 [Gongronella butleri]|nr:hypothetical protein BC940DRAFT_136969 [Gongronella butleri]